MHRYCVRSLLVVVVALQEIVEDTTIYLKLKPHLRLAYLCSRCLWRTESIQSLFPRGYAPKKKRLGDIAGAQFALRLLIPLTH